MTVNAIRSAAEAGGVVFLHYQKRKNEKVKRE